MEMLKGQWRRAGLSTVCLICRTTSNRSVHDEAHVIYRQGLDKIAQIETWRGCQEWAG